MRPSFLSMVLVLLGLLSACGGGGGSGGTGVTCDIQVNTVVVGTPVSGTLDETDCRVSELGGDAGDNTFVDAYMLAIPEFGPYTISLESNNFDTLLILTDLIVLTDPNNPSIYVASDDDGGVGTNSQLSITLTPQKYLVLVNSATLMPVTGDYTLSVTAGDTPTPLPGGNPVPLVNMVTPSSIPMPGSGLTETVNVFGTDFISSSIVRLDGNDLATNYLGPTSLGATIVGGVTAFPLGLHEVTVFTPGPGGGLSGPVGIAAYKELSVGDMVTDPTGATLYASLPAANAVGVLNPVTGEVGASVFVGSMPGPLAISDDGSTLYAGLNGAAMVVKVDTATLTVTNQFALGADPFLGAMYAEDIEVMPGAPDTVAVARKFMSVSPRHAGVAIYDGGLMRPITTPTHTGSNVIEFSDTPETLYGYNNETTEFGIRRLTVDATGVTETALVTGGFPFFGGDFTFREGRLYGNGGAVVDATTLTLSGTFGGIEQPYAAAVDTTARRIHFLDLRLFSNPILRAYDLDLFLATDTLELPPTGSLLSGSAPGLILWGPDALAFATDTGRFFYYNAPTLRGGTAMPALTAGSPVPACGDMAPWGWFPRK